ncbi:hypothetical protein FOXG_13011 [Fusarium oxysporum f. sp. lycopersici 4287]|uniref:Uncharacterized protein n=2 Tax=Fusarium oxysporum TaxID=5507 RepID=A0A0J9VRW5_FUSO4|nr:hypothetical protein FOXG_13011 [Fusarium oxysporum f. sp. lycopersici 4287]KAJ9416839.1 hypothetical protein QL093DRAFT_2400150 [Fusarium oxysporum]KNB13531.1 hypothetical protein FOXG_13011 [Fusarium oxysporum f. sp. lycopersici 4287]
MSGLGDRMLQLDMALTQNGTPATPHLRQARIKRKNSPTDISHLVFGPQPGKKHQLWITDRIMDPQTIPHFFEFLMNGELPGDRKTSRPLLTVEEVKNLTRPASEWAPAPLNRQARSTGEWIGIRIGSYEDSSRLWPIAKELHAMKSRLWEGVPPISERRWQELGLDHPDRFPEACSYFVAVINVFIYLNTKRTKAALRKTYNLIWDHLKVFEQAINAKRKAEVDDGVYEYVSVTGLWYEFIRAQYDSICENAHHWIIEHIDRIRESIVQELALHQPDHPDHYSDKQWELTNKLHDLAENTSQADYTIMMPTDGYKGDSLPVKEDDRLTEAHGGGFRTETISWSANLAWRASDYTKRVRYLDRKEMYSHFEHEDFRQLRSSVGVTDPACMVISAISQIDAQAMAREELRGLPNHPDFVPWIEYARRKSNKRLGFVAYRLCHGYSPEKWDLFKAKLEADISDWGRGTVGINDIRKACKIQWIDGKEKDILDDDIDAAKKHFETISDQAVHERVFLVIDEATMKSYLEPEPGKEKFVVAIDAKYKPADEENVESPAYKGTLRIQGSLLWDELGALLIMQSAFLENLWPMAMHDAEGIYRGIRVTSVLKFSSYQENLNWRLASEIVPKLVAFRRRLDFRSRR